ncbi:MAG: 3-methyl-2-oxobutanoate hydroxymethyltransferase, partial [Kiritimatiellae bacterium]|nr:3-methyl-2-oxobutanoate hydroxymethyltransferase [Kiritimatiellia bacterium]
VENGIPVLGHIGLTPQSVHGIGGYRVQGRTPQEQENLVEDAKQLERAGVFAIVLECVPAELSARITSTLEIPTIGIGAGPHCDGQILVTEDMLGLYEELSPRFVKRYASLARVIHDAVEAYKRDVREGTFPDKEHSY